MKKTLATLGVIVLAGCAQFVPEPLKVVSDESVRISACAERVIDLPHATVDAYPHEAFVTLKPGAKHVLVRWTAQDGGQTITGGDNVYPHNSPDHIALGCAQKLQVVEVEGE